MKCLFIDFLILQEKPQSPRANLALKTSPSAVSVTLPVAQSPQQPRSKRFKLRDGVEEAIKTIRGRVEAKEVVFRTMFCALLLLNIVLPFLVFRFVLLAQLFTRQMQTFQRAKGRHLL